MSIFDDLKSTKVTDTAFYLMFILALIAPGAAYAMVFHMEVFKELDSWKALFMILSISALLLVVATMVVYLSNSDEYEGDEGMKNLGFRAFLTVLTGSYGSLGISYQQGWGFIGVALAAIIGVAITSLMAGLSARFSG